MSLHFTACAWFALGTQSSCADTWRQHEWCERGNAYLYGVAFHWSFTQILGSTEVTPYNLGEVWFAIAVLALAFTGLAVIPPRITALMTTLLAAQADITKSFEELGRFMQENHISRELTLRVQRAAWNACRLKTQRSPENDIRLLDVLSDRLKSELHGEMYTPRLTVHPFFQCLLEDFREKLEEVCHKAVSVSQCADADVLFQAWEIPNTPVMFFLASGKLCYAHGVSTKCGMHEDISSQESLDVAELCAAGLTVDLIEGCVLSEPVLWTRWAHRGDAIATTNSLIIIVNACSFQEVLTKSSIAEPIYRYAVAYVQELGKLSKPSDLQTTEFTNEVISEAFGPRRLRSSKAQGHSKPL